MSIMTKKEFFAQNMSNLFPSLTSLLSAVWKSIKLNMASMILFSALKELGLERKLIPNISTSFASILT